MKRNFNAASQLAKANNAFTNAIEAFRSDRGVVRTLVSTFYHMHQFNKATKKLAKGLGLNHALDERSFGNHWLFEELLTRALERENVPGIERLHKLQAWSHEFWNRKDVKEAGRLGAIKSMRLIKAYARAKAL